MDLQVLLRFELLTAHVARNVLRLHGVHVDDVLLQVRVVRVYFPALGTLWLARVIPGVELVLITPVSLLMQHSHALDLFLSAGLKHQVQLLVLARRARGAGLLLLQALQIVLQLLMHHRQLFAIQTVQRVEGVQRVLLRLLAGGVMMMMVVMMVMM